MLRARQRRADRSGGKVARDSNGAPKPEEDGEEADA
jgi:hypothetical protein